MDFGQVQPVNVLPTDYILDVVGFSQFTEGGYILRRWQPKDFIVMWTLTITGINSPVL